MFGMHAKRSTGWALAVVVSAAIAGCAPEDTAVPVSPPPVQQAPQDVPPEPSTGPLSPSDSFTTVTTPDGERLAINLDGTRAYPLLPREEFLRAVEAENATAAAGAIPTATDGAVGTARSALLPASFSLAPDQTPIRNQGPTRGTCWAFGAIAGLEAVYHREYGVSLDLSEEYLFHVGKTFELFTDYMTTPKQHENNSSLWGFQGSSGSVKQLYYAAVPLEAEAVYLSAGQMNTIRDSIASIGNITPTPADATQEQIDDFDYDVRRIPLNARLRARYKGLGYTRVLPTPAETLTDRLETILASGKEIVADFDLQWKLNATTGIYEWDATEDGGHVMLIVGYDRTAGTFLLKNSWGGANLTRATYEYMRHGFLGGYTFENGAPALNAGYQRQSMWIGNWNMDFDGWRGQLVIRRFVDFRNPSDTDTKLGDYYMNGQVYAVNGHFEENGRKAVMYISDTTGRIQPGTLTGKRHDLYLMGGGSTIAAGFHTYNNAPRGSQIRRDAIPYTYGSGFTESKWLGAWDMNHDGHTGTLYIDGFTTSHIVKARYVASDGTSKAVSGSSEPNSPFRLHITIAFNAASPQPFDLYFHTWTAGTFSGTTVWNGDTFGAVGYK